MKNVGEKLGKEAWIICFLDILGYRELVNKLYMHPSKVCDLREGIKEVIRSGLNMFNDYNGRGKEIVEHIEFQVISDSILILLPLYNTHNRFPNFDIKDNILVHIQMFLLIAAHFYIRVTSKLGYFLRGAVSIGAHYQSPFDENNPKNQFIFSKALIDACKLEKKAIYPRILIDNDVVKILKEDTELSLSSDYCVAKDYDNLYFLDILNFLKGTHPNEKKMLQNMVEIIKQQVKKHKGNHKIMRKYLYYTEYHNKFVQKKWSKDIDLLIDKKVFNKCAVAKWRIQRFIQKITLFFKGFSKLDSAKRLFRNSAYEDRSSRC